MGFKSTNPLIDSRHPLGHKFPSGPDSAPPGPPTSMSSHGGDVITSLQGKYGAVKNLRLSTSTALSLSFLCSTSRHQLARSETSSTLSSTYVYPNSTLTLSYLLANFQGLVLGCIEADFRKQILVGKLLTRAIRFTILCTSPTSKLKKILTNVHYEY